MFSGDETFTVRFRIRKLQHGLTVSRAESELEQMSRQLEESMDSVHTLSAERDTIKRQMQVEHSM